MSSLPSTIIIKNKHLGQLLQSLSEGNTTWQTSSVLSKRIIRAFLFIEWKGKMISNGFENSSMQPPMLPLTLRNNLQLSRKLSCKKFISMLRGASQETTFS